MRFSVLAAMGTVIVGTTLAATPARADHGLDRLRDQYREDRRAIDDRYQDNLTRLNNRFAHDLSQLNEDLRIARLSTHGAQRVFVEQVFAQRRVALHNDFEQKRESLERRWNAQRDRLREEFGIARARYENRIQIGDSHFYVAPYGPQYGAPNGPGRPVVVHDVHYHVGRPAPPALGYLNLVLSLLD